MGVINKLKGRMQDPPYKKLTDKFPEFNQATDTVVSGSSINQRMAKMKSLRAGRDAALDLNNLNVGNVGNTDAARKATRTTRNTNTGEYTTYQLYDKDKLKSSVSTDGPNKGHGPAHCDVSYMHRPYWSDMRKRNTLGPGKVGDNSSGYTIPEADYEYAATPGMAVGEQVSSAVTDAFSNALSAQLDKESGTDQVDQENKDKAIQSDYDKAKAEKQKAKKALKEARQKRKEKRQTPRLERQAKRKQKRADRINSKL